MSRQLIRAIRSKKHLWHIGISRDKYGNRKTLCGRTIKRAWVSSPGFNFFPLRCPGCNKLGDFDALITELKELTVEE